MAIDAVTGKVYDFPGSGRGLAFRLDSNLLIANPPYSSSPNDELYAYPGFPTDSVSVSYYLWHDNKLELIYEEACSIMNCRQRCGKE
jgi:hypothetical protein